jgi:hypothetical protein
MRRFNRHELFFLGTIQDLIQPDFQLFEGILRIKDILSVVG